MINDVISLNIDSYSLFSKDLGAILSCRLTLTLADFGVGCDVIVHALHVPRQVCNVCRHIKVHLRG